jgi:hydroxymethylpyrimidine pyrophosphatase-like HAD family hydrolase
VRKKASAVRLRDHPLGRDLDLPAAAKAFMDALARSTFRGLVLDYDGTLVTHEGRKEPMSEALAGEITRLLDEGLALAIATGRGGSAGEDLRKVLPERHWDSIVVCYYNGGHTQPLRINIDDERPASDPRLDAPRAWLLQSKAFVAEPTFRDSHVQLTIEMANLSDVNILTEEFAAEANLDRRLRLARSSHTVDICLADACKTTAAVMLAERTQASLDCILCMGDSGAISGNDHALLGLSRGVSVGRVCDRPDAAWSLFGDRLVGPDAVLAILRALRPGIDGHRLGVHGLEGMDHSS